MRKFRRYKKIYEDDAQQNPQQQQPAQNGQQPAQGQVDINLCVQNVNKFIGTLYQTIQSTVKENLEKSCPELIAIFKDTKSPYAQNAKNVSDKFTAFTNDQINADNGDSVAKAITDFGDFMTSISEFGKTVAEEASKQLQNQQQPAQNQQQQQQPAQNQQQPQQPVQNNQQQPAQQQPQQTQESYNSNMFGQKLYENLQKAYYMQLLNNKNI